MTTTSRDEILRRVRQALGDQPGTTPDPTTIPRTYQTTHATRTPEQRTHLLADNLTDYRAHVHHTDTTALPTTIARLLTDHGTRSAVIPPGVPTDWLSATTGIHIHHDHGELTAHQLDTIDTVITGCALAIAETGTIVLDTSPDQGRRILTLVPDHHICIINTPTQVVDSLPQALPHLDPTHPLTWISGPSATSDIELDRVEGVHGPRTLDVILIHDNRD
ncbi:LutC/YkgG family protein [Actinacidiphila paucisporea]|uniref:L-lactate dehydrogenase complex protein LldG n=1 Tax=Actinacidiphila paucisporea TaxID=310782 RepID=A0A1M7AX85_9ACTN|nr:LUD domain-containing protein [Actinacidiphila paucisporea]SHL47334.1 L-lactate dehydrogenase complex protein LldG [Actinacidiphila paucisporea]